MIRNLEGDHEIFPPLHRIGWLIYDATDNMGDTLMKGTRKFKKKGIPYEEIARIKFQNIETQKRYRVNMVEPVSKKDLEKLGTSLLEAEYTIADDGTETISGMTEYRLEDAPPAFQGLIADYRRRMIHLIRDEPSIGDMLNDLVKAGIMEELPEGILPEGVSAFEFKPKPKNEWKLYGIGSEIEFPYGEMLKDSKGWDFELVGGTPPRLTWPEELGTIRVVDLHGDKSELNPLKFKLEWRRVAS